MSPETSTSPQHIELTTALAQLHTQITAVLATTPPGHPAAPAVAAFVGAMMARTRAYYAGDEQAARALNDASVTVFAGAGHHVLFDPFPPGAHLSPLAPEFESKPQPPPTEYPRACPPRFQQQFQQQFEFQQLQQLQQYQQYQQLQHYHGQTPNQYYYQHAYQPHPQHAYAQHQPFPQFSTESARGRRRRFGEYDPRATS